MRVIVGVERADQVEPIRKLLLGLGLECGQDDCVPLTDLAMRLAKGPAELVLAGVRPDQVEDLGMIRQALTLTGAPVLAMGPTTDPQHILQTTRAGAREYLDEANLGEDLPAALEKLRQSGEVKGRTGLVVSVISATPGSGVTTVATNLAFTWAQKYPERVALVELGREAADLALSLDLNPVHTVADVAHNWQRMDAALLQKSMTAHAGGVKVLAYKPETLAGEAIEPQVVRKAVILLHSLYAVSVLDLGHSLSDEHCEAMRLSDIIAVVLRLDVPALRQARQFLRQCAEKGVPRDRIRLIANRYGQRGQVAWKKAEEAVGAPFADYIPEDSGKLNQALNHGQPVVRYSRFAGITRRFAKLANQLNGRAV
jgi:pilus assembly protein CpaE